MAANPVREKCAPLAVRALQPGDATRRLNRPTRRGAELRNLVEQAKREPTNGRREALARLLLLLRPTALARIHRHLSARGVGPEHADEALQMTNFNFITKGLEQYDGKASPATYFASIAERCAADVVRRLCRDVSRVSIEDGPGVSRPPPLPRKGRTAAGPPRRRKLTRTTAVVAMVEAELCSDPASRARTAQALIACMRELSATYREAISLYCLEAIGDHATCASRAGVNTEAFMQRLSRARQQLAASLASKLDEEADRG